jgi:hypothetical protein
MHGLLQAEARIEEPLPCRAGDDEGQRHRVEIDRPKHAFAADALVDQDGESETERDGDADIEAAEDSQILQRLVPIGLREQPDIAIEADKLVDRHQPRVGEGEPDRP